MTLEQLADRNVYDGPIEEELEELTYKGYGRIEVILEASPKTLKAVNVAGLSLDVSHLNCSFWFETEIQTWSERVAYDMLYQELNNCEKKIEQELNQAGFNPSVKHYSDEMQIKLIS